MGVHVETVVIVWIFYSVGFKMYVKHPCFIMCSL